MYKDIKMIKNTIMPKGEFELLKPFEFRTMYELGNKGNNRGTYKDMLSNQGIDHISIDLNGKDGALALDLQKPINMPTRDIVTNFGTSEHIEDQEAVFKNIHNLSHNWMVGFVPRVGNSPGHGLWHFETDFFEQLAELNNYGIHKIYIDNTKPREIICYSFYKQYIKKFKWSDSLPMHKEINGKGGVTW